MGKYSYSSIEMQMNKVLKSHQEDLDLLIARADAENTSLKETISESDALLRSLGYAPERAEPKPTGTEPSQEVSVPIPVTVSWDEMVRQADERYPYEVELEDLLSRAEFENAYRDLENINRQFAQSTSLNEADLSLLITAAALQTLRWVLMEKAGRFLGVTDRITDSEGEKRVRQLKKDFVEKHKDWPAEKQFQGKRLRQSEGKTWKEIVLGGVPYDAIKGSKEVLGKGLDGNTHRLKTLGHDPLLGWFFGTANILTDTITLNTFASYRVERGAVQNVPVSILQIVRESFDQVEKDRHLLPAAVFRQAVHYQSDLYTKRGLPIPVLGVFNESLAGELYSSQYDFLRFARDTIGGVSAATSIFINMIIGLLHGLFYDKKRDGERGLFEVRTRKILLYSNALAASGNVAMSLLTKNAKTLDVGGLVATVSRIYSDARFIAKAKVDFIQSKLDDELRKIANDADELLYII